MQPTPLRPATRRAGPRRGTVLILVVAVLGLLMILGTAFITVTTLDRNSTRSIALSTQAELSMKAAINSAVDSIRRDMFDPTGQFLLTGGVLAGGGGVGPLNGAPNQPLPVLVGEYMDYPDPAVDEWLAPVEPEIFPRPQGATAPPGASANAPYWTNVSRVGTPVQTWFRDPANCRNVPADPAWRLNGEPALADADGDNVPDSIWCTIPNGQVLGELQWEAAVRVVDLSGLINLNNAIRPQRSTANTQVTVQFPDPAWNTPETQDLAGSPTTSELGRYLTGAGTNAYLFEQFCRFVGGGSSTANPSPAIGSYPNLPLAGIDPSNFATNFTGHPQTAHLMGLAMRPRAPFGAFNAYGLGLETAYRWRNGLARDDVRTPAERAFYSTSGVIPPTQWEGLPWIHNPGDPRYTGAQAALDWRQPIRPNGSTAAGPGLDLARPSAAGFTTQGSVLGGATSGGQTRARHLVTGMSAVANLMVGPPLHSQFEYLDMDSNGGSALPPLAQRLGLTTLSGLNNPNNSGPAYSVHRGLLRGENYQVPMCQDDSSKFAADDPSQGGAGTRVANDGFTGDVKYGGKSLSVVASTGRTLIQTATKNFPMRAWRIAGPNQAAFDTGQVQATEAGSLNGQNPRFSPVSEEVAGARGRQFRAAIETIVFRAVQTTAGTAAPDPLFGFRAPTGTTPPPNTYVPDDQFLPINPLLLVSTNSTELAKVQRWWYLKELADLFMVALDGYLGSDPARNAIYLGSNVPAGAFYRADGSTGIESGAGAIRDYMALMCAHLAANSVDYLDNDIIPTAFTYIYFNPWASGTDKRKMVRVLGVEHTPVIKNKATRVGSDYEVSLENPFDDDITCKDLAIRDVSSSTGKVYNVRTGGTLTIGPFATATIRFQAGTSDPGELTQFALVHQRSLHAWLDVYEDGQQTWSVDKNKMHLSKPVGNTDTGTTATGATLQVDSGNSGTNLPRAQLKNLSDVPPLASHLSPAARWMTAVDINRIPTLGGIYVGNTTPAVGQFQSWTQRARTAQAAWVGSAYTVRGAAGKIDFLAPNQDVTIAASPAAHAGLNWKTVLDQAQQVWDPVTNSARTVRRSGLTTALPGGVALTAAPTPSRVDVFYDYDLLTPGQRLFMFFSKYDPMIDLVNNDKNAVIDVDGAASNTSRISLTWTGGQNRPRAGLEGTLYGLININTAPYRVLRYLPWTNGGVTGSFPAYSANEDAMRDNLARSIIAYRSQNQNAAFFGWRRRAGSGLEYQGGNVYQDLLGATGPSRVARGRGGYGFLSIGELMNFASQNPGTSSAVVTDRIDQFCFSSADLNYKNGDWTGGVSSTGGDGVRNDLEERDLLFRNVSSMISTRSDTFCVYVFVRARNSAGEVVSQRRGYVIVDRTQVRLPGDAPVVYGPYDNN